MRLRKLIGLRLRVEIDEWDEGKPPILPPGTLVRLEYGPDRQVYGFIELDEPCVCHRPGTNQMWTLKTLVVAMNMQGDSLERIAEENPRLPLLVGIANVLSPIAENARLLDFSKLEYFARGQLLRVG